MSYLRYLPCLTCEAEIAIDIPRGESYQWDNKGGGPYCVSCWRWQRQIDALEKRVDKLEHAQKIPLP